MDSRPALRNKPRDGRVRRCGLKKLNTATLEIKNRHAHLLFGDGFLCDWRFAQKLFEDRNRFGERFHGYAEMMNPHKNRFIAGLTH